MRVVLDTNVIVSGLNFPGNERLVLELAFRGRFELYLSPFIRSRVTTPTTVSWNVRRLPPPTTWLPATAGICCPLRTTKERESSTRPDFCQHWRHSSDAARYRTNEETDRSVR